MTQDGVRPSDLLEKARQQLQPYETVKFTGQSVATIARAGDGFVVNFRDGAVQLASTVLVATGVVDELPRLKGIEALFGKSVHVCPYCDGWENRNAPLAVYGRGEKGANFANLLRQWTEDLVLCTDGEPLLPALQHKLRERGIAVKSDAIASLEGHEGCLSDIVFQNGERLSRQALFFTTGQHPRSPLLEALGCAFDRKGGVACDPDGHTSVPGVYVAGDVSRDVQIAIIAAAEGARAGLAINKHLVGEL
jgi:thioredoxin reductase